MKSFDTKRPNANFEAFLDANAKYIFASQNIPFENKVYGMQATCEARHLQSQVNEVNDRLKFAAEPKVKVREKMVSDALFNNQITLSDNSVITFNRKDTHYINRQNEKWSDNSGGSTAGNPISQLNDMCQLLVDDAKVSGAGAFQLICARDIVNALLSNTKFRDNTKFDAGIKLTDIKSPSWNVNGATFHGQFSAGSFRINLWSYNAKFEVPSGYGYANEGTLQPFIPNGTNSF